MTRIKSSPIILQILHNKPLPPSLHNNIIVMIKVNLLVRLHPWQQDLPEGQYVIITAKCMPSFNMVLKNLKTEEFNTIVTARSNNFNINA